MASNNTIEFITAVNFIEAARAAMNGRSDKGQRPEAALAFINADTHAEREQAVAEYGAGFVRRGLREQAVFHADDEEIANIFWMLRDSIESDGTVLDDMFSDDVEVEDV